MASFSILNAFSLVLTAAAAAGSVYQLLAAYGVRRLAVQKRPLPTEHPPVTLLKPLCGGESELYQNLLSFCRQEYPVWQMVCGVRDANDPAAAVVRQLQADLPHADIALVVDPALHGTNYKISNVINMMKVAKHGVVVLSDSDMHVGPTYIETVVGTLMRPGTGIATCLYVGRPVPGMWSRLGAAGINFGFLPSVTVSKLLGGKTGCFGATIATSRAVLDSVGGFAALKDQLADDYELGALVHAAGLNVTVSPYFVDTTVDEPSFAALFRHELRWGRTIRNTAPLGYAGSATHPVPLALLGLAVGLTAAVPWLILACVLVSAVLCRWVLVATVKRLLGAPVPPWWLLLPRDVLSLGILILAFCGRSVSWRNSDFHLDRAGALVADGEIRA